MNLFRTVVVILVLAVVPPRFGYADFLKGLEGYERGDYATALKEWKPLAEQGDIEAQINLAEMYRFGWGVPQDSKEAIKWLRLSAVQGDASSAYKLGVIYKGHGSPSVPADPDEAAMWFQIAINRGNTEALYDLGELYYREGHFKDAAELLRLSSISGNASAAYIVGKLYERGLGVPHDIKEAARWYRLATQKGLSAAQVRRVELGAKEAQTASTPPRTPSPTKKIARTIPTPRVEDAAPPASPVTKHQDVAGVISKEPKSIRPSPSASGSGFFVSKMGHVVTSAHVVKGCSRVTVVDNANKQTRAEVISADRRNDLALLKLSSLKMTFSDTKALIRKFGIRLVPLAADGLMRSEDVELGEKVMIAGYPSGDFFSNTIKVTLGIVSATRGMGDDSDRFQLDAAVQPGNSGGPIYDEHGNIVGVVVSQLKKLRVAEAVGSLPENVNFGIKASTVRQFLTASGLASKWSERSKAMSNYELAKIAEKQALMVMCLQ